jgi:hypothetical protein
MNIIPPKTPKPYDPDVKAVCQVLCGKNPVAVPIKVSPNSKDAWCWFNVSEKVRTEGGEAIHGWNIVAYKGIQLIALPHTVWKAPDGVLVDITPTQHPALSLDRVVFVADDYLQTWLANVEPKTQRPSQRPFPFSGRRLWPQIAALIKEQEALRRANKLDEADVKAHEINTLLVSAGAVKGAS